MLGRQCPGGAAGRHRLGVKWTQHFLFGFRVRSRGGSLVPSDAAWRDHGDKEAVMALVNRHRCRGRNVGPPRNPTLRIHWMYCPGLLVWNNYATCGSQIMERWQTTGSARMSIVAAYQRCDSGGTKCRILVVLS
jgi:hypothetical protein